MQEAEELAEDLRDLENIDERGIKRIVAGLERRVRKNQELRMKYADSPDKFMESELEVHEILQKLLALAGEAELYVQLLAHASVPLILSLLHHENMDIVCTAVDLLQELTDADVIEDLDEVCPEAVLVSGGKYQDTYPFQVVYPVPNQALPISGRNLLNGISLSVFNFVQFSSI